MTAIDNPRIRPVGDLLNENFFVPRYQRGYRWGQQEINELLDDILQYTLATQNRENRVSKFYCLQPIVVKKKDWYKDQVKISGWELIDGQQRLTSILLVLNYLEEVRKYIDKNLKIYSIDFETRDNCNTFFQTKKYRESIDDTNVDFYHISTAYHHIHSWFETNSHQVEILNTLLKADYNVSIIWYEALSMEAGNEDSSIELFTRLNDGKIPLTDAELIKALLLQADSYPPGEERFIRQRLFEIASEWDDIEAKLQDDKMWLFLTNKSYQPSSRIEFLFKILADKWNDFEEKKFINYKEDEGKPRHFEFLVFEKYLVQKRKECNEEAGKTKDWLGPVNRIWAEIKQIFSSIDEWYNDHQLYHYIGFLLAVEKDKDSLIMELIGLKYDRNNFETEIKKRIAKSVKINKNDRETGIVKSLKQLSYGPDNKEIIKILLLFNIDALINHKKENARFPFHLFKKENITSIEHIHPQNPLSIDTEEERAKTWLENHKISLRSLKDFAEKHTDEINPILQQVEDLIHNYDKEKFKILFSDIIQLYDQITDFNENQLHTLYNLALVDKDLNSQLNNSFFDIKREILRKKALGKYIPIQTHRAFSKYYTSSSSEMIFWNRNDRDAYFAAIENVYLSFICLIE